MPDPPNRSRSKATRALRSLLTVRRPSANDTPGDVFPFGFLRPATIEGKPRPRKTDDRTIALTIGTVIEQALEGVLIAHLPGIAEENEGYFFFDNGAPLRDFDAKIRMGMALGIYGPRVRDDLSLIRQIRNVFAHSREPISFDTPEITEACSHFHFAETKLRLVSHDDAREIFISVSFEYALHLLTHEVVTSDPDPNSEKEPTFSEFDPLPRRSR